MDSYFTDDSMFRRIYRERGAAFGGGRAILMQTAHPLVVAGLLAHSTELDTFRRRLLRTQRVLETIGFGPRQAVDELMEAVAGMHERVRGAIPHEAGRFPKGAEYRGMQPDLMLWVLFTMYDSSQLSYETFVRPLTDEERRGFWSDYRLVGRLFGLGESDLPKRLEDIDEYRAAMLAGDDLYITDWARRRGHEIALDPGEAIPSLVKPVVAVINWITIALLPDRIKRAYGYEPAPLRRELPVKLLGKVAGRGIMPWMPERVRLSPEARGAYRPWEMVVVDRGAEGQPKLVDAAG